MGSWTYAHTHTPRGKKESEQSDAGLENPGVKLWLCVVGCAVEAEETQNKNPLIELILIQVNTYCCLGNAASMITEHFNKSSIMCGRLQNATCPVYGNKPKQFIHLCYYDYTLLDQ